MMVRKSGHENRKIYDDDEKVQGMKSESILVRFSGLTYG